MRKQLNSFPIRTFVFKLVRFHRNSKSFKAPSGLIEDLFTTYEKTKKRKRKEKKKKANRSIIFSLHL